MKLLIRYIQILFLPEKQRKKIVNLHNEVFLLWCLVFIWGLFWHPVVWVGQWCGRVYLLQGSSLIRILIRSGRCLNAYLGKIIVLAYYFNGITYLTLKRPFILSYKLVLSEIVPFIFLKISKQIMSFFFHPLYFICKESKVYMCNLEIWRYKIKLRRFFL